MWYIIKPILVTTLLIIRLYMYLCINVFMFTAIFKTMAYSEYFNNKDCKIGYGNEAQDNNPIDTFKRYWNGDFW